MDQIRKSKSPLPRTLRTALSARRFLNALACVAAILVNSARGAWADEPPFRLALIAPLTGPAASLGQFVQKGVILGLEQLDPQSRARIELVVEDDQFDAKQTISAYRKLNAQRRLDGIFVVGSAPAHALAPLTEKESQLLMAIGASDQSVVTARPHTFIHWVSPATLGNQLAKELLRRDRKRIAFVATETAGALADQQAAIDALKSAGAEERVVYKESFDLSVVDFRSTIASLRAKRVDSVVLVLISGSLASFAKQARDLKLGAELCGMETFEDEAEVKAAQGALFDTWYVNASEPTDDFIRKYQSRWSEHPGWATANAADAVTLLARAAERYGNNINDISDYLRNIKNFSGNAGTYSASLDNRFDVPAALKKVSGDRFIPLPISGTP